jgi:Short-chain dehydrogenases of various substrate specificities
MTRKIPPGGMTGRVCVITGATRGIGRATAAGLAELGASVVLVCRRLEDGKLVARELAQNHHAPPAEVDRWTCRPSARFERARTPSAATTSDSTCW